jgi:hypothetical protein
MAGAGNQKKGRGFDAAPPHREQHLLREEHLLGVEAVAHGAPGQHHTVGRTDDLPVVHQTLLREWLILEAAILLMHPEYTCAYLNIQTWVFFWVVFDGCLVVLQGEGMISL